MLLNEERKDATEYTKQCNEKLLQDMDARYLEEELHDVEAAKKRIILEFGNEDVIDYDGTVLFDSKRYKKKVSGDFPDTVNPYLWQSRKDNELAGVIQLTQDYYVVTGIDVSIIGFIRTEHGWIIQDCGNYIESARISLRLVEMALNENIKDNIVGIIISHTHLDHYAGIEAFITKEQVGVPEEGKIPIIAPSEFEQSLIDDNLYAGIAMSRRLQYQGGMFLAKDEKGSVGVGLNQTEIMFGTQSFIFPNIFIDKNKTLELDGTKVEFILSPNTETRAHMCSYYPKQKVLFLGDDAMGTLHNTYTMRGARVRDANFWGGLFYHLYVSYGNEVEAIYQGHGVVQVKEDEYSNHLKKYLLDHAAAYKYTNDQALLLANKGYKLNEVGHHINMPKEICKKWYIRPHYGDYTFNARGVYQRYLGFYDGNPVNLFPLETKEMARKIVEYIGSYEKVLEHAKQDFTKGEYQWVATITNYLVFLDQENKEARYLCADALEQLGYQAESGLWRNAYLSGAYELRHPDEVKQRDIRYMDNREVLPYVSAELILDHLGINFDGEKALALRESFVFRILPEQETAQKEEYHRVQIYKGTILHEKVLKENIKKEETIISLTKLELYQLAVKKYEAKQKNSEAERIIELLEKYVVDTSKYRNFNLIEPCVNTDLGN